MIAPHQANEAMRKERLLEEIVAGEIGEITDGQIYVAAFQTALDLIVFQRYRPQISPWRDAGERLQQARQEHDVTDIRERDGEGIGGDGGIEVLGIEQPALDPVQRLTSHRHEREGAR